VADGRLGSFSAQTDTLMGRFCDDVYSPAYRMCRWDELGDTVLPIRSSFLRKEQIWIVLLSGKEAEHAPTRDGVGLGVVPGG
jgi:hypothetical protein